MRTQTELGGLTLLGNQHTSYAADYAPEVLEAFDNKHPGNDYFVKFICPEFTSLCPMTGQPDFATLTLDYIPEARCVELKSLKLYIWSFRNEGCYHEAVTNRILDDLVQALEPRFMRLTAKFFVRGGIFTNVVAEHRQPGWESAPQVDLAQFPPNSNTRG